MNKYCLNQFSFYLLLLITGDPCMFFTGVEYFKLMQIIMVWENCQSNMKDNFNNGKTLFDGSVTASSTMVDFFKNECPLSKGLGMYYVYPNKKEFREKDPTIGKISRGCRPSLPTSNCTY